MRRTLPNELSKYAETPEFTEATVPEKLTKLHDTKPDTWGKIVILEGSLDYIIPGHDPERQSLTPGISGWIWPTEKHRVELIGSVRFKVEFYRACR